MSKFALMLCWLAIVFAGTQSAAGRQSAPSENVQPGSTSTLSQSPETQPAENQPKPAIAPRVNRNGRTTLATIVQSPSTNTRGYKVEIYSDGSAKVEAGPSRLALRSEPAQPENLPAATIDAKALRRLLRKIGDVSKIPIGPCAKSTSFGTRTQITYARKTSEDLQCIRQQAAEDDSSLAQSSRELAKLVDSILRRVRMDHGLSLPTPQN
jgi:hypothetical protein